MISIEIICLGVIISYSMALLMTLILQCIRLFEKGRKKEDAVS